LSQEHQLPSVKDDVERIVDLFTQKLGYKRVLPGLADDPKHAYIEEKLSTWLKERNASDCIVFYYSGHGMVEHGEHYLLTNESEIDNLAVTALPTAQLARMLAGSCVRQFLVILDTCYSGQGSQNFANIANLYSTSLHPDHESACRLYAIAAARPTEEAFQSAFSEVFVDVLQNPPLACGNERFLVSYEHLIEEVNQKLKSEKKVRQKANLTPPQNLQGPPNFFPNPRWSPSDSALPLNPKSNNLPSELPIRRTRPNLSLMTVTVACVAIIIATIWYVANSPSREANSSSADDGGPPPIEPTTSVSDQASLPGAEDAGPLSSVPSPSIWKDLGLILQDHALLHYFESAASSSLPGADLHGNVDFGGARTFVPEGVEFDVAWTGAPSVDADGKPHFARPDQKIERILSVKTALTESWTCQLRPAGLLTSGVQFGPGLMIATSTSMANTVKEYSGPSLTRVCWVPRFEKNRNIAVNEWLKELKDGNPLQQLAAAAAILSQGPLITDSNARQKLAKQLLDFLKVGPDKSFMRLVAIATARLDAETSISALETIAVSHQSEFRQADAACAIGLLDPITPRLLTTIREIIAESNTRGRQVLLGELSHQQRILRFSDEETEQSLRQLLRHSLTTDSDESCRATAATVIERIWFFSESSKRSEADLDAIRRALTRTSITVFEKNMLQGVLDRMSAAVHARPLSAPQKALNTFKYFEFKTINGTRAEFSHDGSRLAVMGGADVWAFSLQTGQSWRFVGEDPRSIETIAVSGDGSYIAGMAAGTNEQPTSVYVWKCQDSGEMSDSPISPITSVGPAKLVAPNRGIAFTEDNRLLVNMGKNQAEKDQLLILDAAEDFRQLRELVGRNGTWRDLTTVETEGTIRGLSPDGTVFAVSSVTKPGMNVEVRTPDGVNVASLPKGEWGSQVRFSHCGEYLVIRRPRQDLAEFEVWKTNPTEFVGSCTFPSIHFSNMNLSPDGRSLALVDSDGQGKIYRASAGLKFELENEKTETNDICFSPDGLHIAWIKWGGKVIIEPHSNSWSPAAGHHD
jgi:hypothetical protein